MAKPPGIGSLVQSAQDPLINVGLRQTGEILSSALYVEQPSLSFGHRLALSSWQQVGL